MKISKGSFIRFFDKKFEVMSVQDEVDFWDSKTKSFVGEHLEVKLHSIGSSSLMADKVVKIYLDGKIKCYDVARDGDVISFINEKSIETTDFKIIS